MFRVKYDMTEGRLRRIGTRRSGFMRQHSGSPMSRRRYGVAPNAGSKIPDKIRVATPATNVTSPFLAGSGMSQRYSPVWERAEDPTLAEDFMPADPQTQNKIFRNLIMFDPIAGPATEYWRDLAFSQNLILSGIRDEKVMQLYQDALYSSGIIPIMPFLLSDYLTFGRFVFHMTMNERLGFWDEVIPHDLDYVSIKVSPIPSMDPLIDLQPTQDAREWATSADPRAAEQRSTIDPVLISMLAAGKPIPLAPENTMFLPRRVFSTDYYGTSYLTRIMPFKIYEKAILDASIAGARRRAGPLWHITVWPDATDDEMSEVLDLFFAAEEDPIGGKVLTREGVTVNTVGGGSADFWKLSDEWAFLAEAKMRALGISDTFLSGEANYNSMDMVLTVFLEKIRAVRALFTRKIILEKMFLQLAKMHNFVKRSEADLAHGIRTGRKNRQRTESEYQIPTAEWDKPLSPVADDAYMAILSTLEESGLPIPIRMKAQVAGFDIDKALDSFHSDLETQKQIYEYKRAKAMLAQQYGFDESGGFTGGEGGGGLGGLGGGLGGGGELPGFGEEEIPGLGGGEAGGAPEAPPAPAGGEAGGAPEAPPAAPAGGAEGFGAGLAAARFPVNTPPRRLVQAKVRAANSINIIDELEQLPLWDEEGGLFGLTKRRVAKILDRIDHTDPDVRRRRDLAEQLPRTLRQTEGLNRVQSEIVQYLAVRLGYIPPVSFPEETFDRLRQYIIGKRNGNGLTRAISNEIVMLSKIAEAGGRRINSHLSKHVNPTRLVNQAENDLPDRYLLTGYVAPNDSPFSKR